ncbi:MAG: hypothetical protein KAX99_00895 [Azonexus sp.]|nr:hypothetical protein [Azonexus sp.]
MNAAPENDDAGRAPGKVGTSQIQHSHRTAPQVAGQCNQALNLIRQHQPALSFVLAAKHVPPEWPAPRFWEVQP